MILHWNTMHGSDFCHGNMSPLWKFQRPRIIVCHGSLMMRSRSVHPDHLIVTGESCTVLLLERTVYITFRSAFLHSESCTICYWVTWHLNILPPSGFPQILSLPMWLTSYMISSIHQHCLFVWVNLEQLSCSLCTVPCHCDLVLINGSFHSHSLLSECFASN